MDLHTVLKQGITFGPFQTDHHRAIVNAEFQAAFLRHVAEAIVPNLTIGTDTVEGNVRALFDEDRYHGPHSAVKYRYSFEGNFLQGGRRETVQQVFDYEPGSPGFRLVFQEARITTARDRERYREQEDGARRRLDREAEDVLPPGLSEVEHWEACAQVWTRCGSVLAGFLGPTGARPLEHHLCERFAELHPSSEPFLLKKLLDPSPVLAAYAFKCWIRVVTPEKHRLPPAALARTEPIETHSGCFISTVPLGQWLEEFWHE